MADESSYDLKTKAKVAGAGPMGIAVKAGQTYYWCACGHSKTQPWCDGSHMTVNEEEGTKFQPVAWTAEKDDTKYLCMCKQTSTAPLCDGSHMKLQK